MQILATCMNQWPKLHSESVLEAVEIDAEYSKTLNNRSTPNSRPTLPLAGYSDPPILRGLAGYSDPSSKVQAVARTLGLAGYSDPPPPSTGWLLQPPTCSVHALIRHTRDTWCKTTQTSTCHMMTCTCNSMCQCLSCASFRGWPVIPTPLQAPYSDPIQFFVGPWPVIPTPPKNRTTHAYSAHYDY